MGGTMGEARVAEVDPLPLSDMKLFRVNDDGSVAGADKWRIVPFSRGSSLSFGWLSGPDRIFHVSEDATSLIVRDVETGKVIETVSLPEDFDPHQDKFDCIGGGCFTIEVAGGNRIYDLRNRRWLKKPGERLDLTVLSEDSSLALFSDAVERTELQVVDQESGNVLTRFARPFDSTMCFTPDDQIAAITDQEVLTLSLRDPQTGEVIEVLRPFAWAGWVFPILLVGYAVWMIGWMRASAREGGPAWLDVVIVGGIPLTLLAIRAVVAGHPLDVGRGTHLHAQGITVAIATSFAFGVVFGRGRLVVRLMFFGLFAACLVAGLAVVFRDDSRTAWAGLATSLLPAVLSLVTFTLLRMLGWRLVQSRGAVGVKEDSRLANAAPENRRVSLRDLLVATAVVALLLAAVRPIAGSLGVVLEFSYAWTLIASSQFLVLGIVSLTLSRSRFLFVLTCLLALIAAGLLGLASWSRFVAGASGPWLSWVFDNHRIVMTAAISLTVFLVPMRWRGVRWPALRIP